MCLCYEVYADQPMPIPVQLSILAYVIDKFATESRHIKLWQPYHHLENMRRIAVICRCKKTENHSCYLPGWSNSTGPSLNVDSLSFDGIYVKIHRVNYDFPSIKFFQDSE